MFLAVLFLFTSVLCNDDIQTYRINVKVPGGKINEDVVVDPKRNVMTINVGDVSHLKSFWCQSINLHDFEKKKVAIKNIDYGFCIIIDTKETYTDSMDLLDKIKRLQYKHEIKDNIMVRADRTTQREVSEMAGDKIADFCRGYDVYYGKKVDHDGMLIAVKNAKRVKRADRKVRSLWGNGCWMFCGTCIVGAENIKEEKILKEKSDLVKF